MSDILLACDALRSPPMQQGTKIGLFSLHLFLLLFCFHCKIIPLCRIRIVLVKQTWVWNQKKFLNDICEPRMLFYCFTFKFDWLKFNIMIFFFCFIFLILCFFGFMFEVHKRLHKSNTKCNTKRNYKIYNHKTLTMMVIYNYYNKYS